MDCPAQSQYGKLGSISELQVTPNEQLDQ